MLSVEEHQREADALSSRSISALCAHAQHDTNGMHEGIDGIEQEEYKEDTHVHRKLLHQLKTGGREGGGTKGGKGSRQQMAKGGWASEEAVCHEYHRRAHTNALT
jgi:hypothetical protein